MDFAGKRCLVLGLAREGISLVRFLSEQGATVTATDSAPATSLGERLAEIQGSARVVAGGDHPELLGDVDTLFVSPGVPDSNPVYRAARGRGTTIGSMTTLFFDLCPAPVVGITGSSGKTTTTGLIGHILREAGADVVVGGNIGDPMIDLLPRIRPSTTVVLELSSFQLELLRRSPHIAVVTNITPNHLDRHGTMDAYVAAKQRIVDHQRAGDIAVLNECDPAVAEFSRVTPAQVRWFGGETGPGCAVRDGEIVLLGDGADAPVLPVADIPLPGRHNSENVQAACAAVDALGVTAEDMARAIRSFRPPPHRLEPIGTHAGVTYIDDSIATTPARSMVALCAIDRPIVLIAGGRDKHLPWQEWAHLVSQRARALVLLGESADLIEDAVRTELRTGPGLLSADGVLRARTLDEAVRLASSRAHAGDVVLLSPGCTSYDMFTDYQERGEMFARAVEQLNAA